MDSTDKIQERWQELVEKKALVVDGVDSDEDIIYVIDVEQLKAVDPALCEEYLAEIDQTILSLFAKGFVDLTFEDNEVGVSISSKGSEWCKAQE